MMIEKISQEYIELISNLFGSFSNLNKHDSVQLSHMQSHVLEFMYMQKRPLNPKEISAGLNISKQQLTNLIRGLELGGYLTKVPDEKDKRAVLVSLTPAGVEIGEKKWALIYQKFSHKLDTLTEEDKIDLAFALHKINVLLKKMED